MSGRRRAEPLVDRTCVWCGRPLPDRGRRPGPPPQYCGPSCRQRAYEARRAQPVAPRRAKRLVGFAGAKRGLLGHLHAVDPRTPIELFGGVRTLCGVLARPVPRRFSEHDREACARCGLLAAAALAAAGVTPPGASAPGPRVDHPDPG